jgi:hypothetical protein
MKNIALPAFLGITLLACQPVSDPGTPGPGGPSTSAPAADARSQPTPPASPVTSMEPPPGPPAPPSTPPAGSGQSPTPPVTTSDAGSPPPATDAEAPAPTTPADAGPAATPAGGPFTCTLIIGIQATGQWYGAGFENLVDNARWEVISVHSAKVEAWANPNDKLWSSKPSSPCAMNAGNPDRILFTGLNWIYDKVEQWVPPLTASVKNLQAKYPGVKRIELRTFVRAPGNKPCPGGSDYKSFIKPAQDEANEIVAKMFPGLVYVAPKLEVRTCADFGGRAPHFSSEGAKAVAKIVADAYGGKTQ